jgi:hypothetical protein
MEDGSFCVEVTLRVNTKQPNDLANRMQLWLEEWVHANRYWETSLFESVGGRLDFFEDFAQVPSCSVSGPDLLCLHLQSRPGARKWWKDWLVLRILKELPNAFPEFAEVQKITDCPDNLQD